MRLIFIALIVFPLMVSASESDYAKAWCTHGAVEYRLPNGTRVDCLTATHAIEFDYGHKWAESVGQSIYYSKITEKKQGIVLILKPDEYRFFYRAAMACGYCDIWIVEY